MNSQKRGPESWAKNHSKNLLLCFLTLFGVILLFAAKSGYAGNATWNNNPANGDWNTATNWTPNTVPGGSDIATFNSSNITDITISEYSEVLEILFNPGASSFTYTVSHFDGLIFTIVGIINNSGVTQQFIADVGAEGNPGFLGFEGNASPGTLTLFTARPGTVPGGEGALIEFLDFASAGEGEFIIEGAASSGLAGGRAIFFSSSTANNATLTSEGGQAAGAPGGLILLQNQSHADAATLIANGGVNGGGGGEIQFLSSAAGDSARIEVFGNGFLDVSAHAAIAVGSIEGDGLILLAANKFTVGSNGLSTVFSGVLREATGSGGSLAKTGTGTLTLSGASTYTGGTTVSQGTLVVTNTSGSATGTGSLLVSAGTLGGSGTISGAVTVGTGSDSGAFLAPAHGTNKQLTLTIQSSLTFNSDSTYTYTFKAKRNKSKTDKVVANGITISNGASFNLSGTAQGTLTQGTVLTVIKNTAATPIAGAFANLPDGAIVNVNGNNLQASYQGGDGNDLTLTVVP
jgi:autotransporter-associated beta strand protein